MHTYSVLHAEPFGYSPKSRKQGKNQRNKLGKNQRNIVTNRSELFERKIHCASVIHRTFISLALSQTKNHPMSRGQNARKCPSLRGRKKIFSEVFRIGENHFAEILTHLSLQIIVHSEAAGTTFFKNPRSIAIDRSARSFFFFLPHLQRQRSGLSIMMCI